MTWHGRLIDLCVGLTVAVWVTVVLHAPWPVAGVIVIFAGLAGVAWRHPMVIAGLAGVAALVALRWGGASGDEDWLAVLFMVSAVSLGAFARPPFAGLGVVAMALVVAWGEHFDWANFVFGAWLMSGVAWLAWLVTNAARRAQVGRIRTERLAAAIPEELAREAVAEERLRLATDVQRVIRTSVMAMREHASRATVSTGEATVEALRSVQRDGQQAITELRRLLGLLRDDDEQPHPQSEGVSPVRHAPRPLWIDVLVTGALISLAIAELSLYGRLWPSWWVVSPWSVALTVVGAGTFGLRRVAPGVGAAALGCVLFVAGTTHVPVSHGFWCGIAFSMLTWAAGSRRSVRHAAGVLVLLIGMSTYGMATAPADVGLDVVLTVTVAVASFVTAARRATLASANSTSARLTAEHSAVSEHAVWAERLVVARELHDVVSHAVVVMVLQAGAAEALLHTDPPGAARAMGLIDSTSAAALDELDRLLTVVASETPDGGVPDFPALVERMRVGGLDVDFRADVGTTARPNPVVYRIVQETLTNALRYAPTARVHVRVTEQNGETKVEVADDGPGPRPGARRGYGLIGMTERVERLAGSVETGPGPEGTGFRVVARIPARVDGDS